MKSNSLMAIPEKNVQNGAWSIHLNKKKENVILHVLGS